MKNYNNLTKEEKHVVNEYKSWVRSDAPIACKLTFALQFQKRAFSLNIQHLLGV